MNGSTFDVQLGNIDNELTSAGLPLRYRPLDCFKKLYGSVPDGPQREKLFDPVTEWYLKRYGEAIRWDGVIARFPILIKGVVFLGQARFVAEQEVLAPFEEGIEGLSKDLAQSLTSGYLMICSRSGFRREHRI